MFQIGGAGMSCVRRVKERGCSLCSLRCCIFGRGGMFSRLPEEGENNNGRGEAGTANPAINSGDAGVLEVEQEEGVGGLASASADSNGTGDEPWPPANRRGSEVGLLS